MYMCIQVELWEGMCYMQLSPGGLGYPGGMQTSQVLSCVMTHAKSADVSNAVCMLHYLVRRDAILLDNKLSKL